MKPLVIVAIAALTILITGCEKEGCMNQSAVNFNADADVDDGSCTYESRTSFWFNEYISNWLSVNYGVTLLSVYLDDVLVGTMNPTDWKVGPDCGGGNFTVTSIHGGAITKSFTYQVRDQSGNLQFDGTINNTANECKSVELVW